MLLIRVTSNYKRYSNICNLPELQIIIGGILCPEYKSIILGYVSWLYISNKNMVILRRLDGL